jgi:hypothetical protein
MKRTFALLACTALLAACGGKNEEIAKVDTTSTPAPMNTTTTSSSSPEVTQNNATAQVTSSSSDTAAAPATGGRRYGVKSGIIEATIDFMGQQKLTTYFDDYGAKEATYATSTTESGVSNSISVTANGYRVDYNAEKREGTKMKATGMLPGVALDATPESLTEAQKAKYNVKELPARDVLGKKTKGYEMSITGVQMKMWLWNGIPIYTENYIGGRSTPIIMKATSIKTDVPVPSEKFVVPSDITVKEMQPPPMSDEPIRPKVTREGGQ